MSKEDTNGNADDTIVSQDENDDATDQGSTSGGSNPHVNSLFGKLPFPKLSSKFGVETWFIKVDAWFELNGYGVRKEKEKYTAIVAHAEDFVIDQVFELTRTPPPNAPYTTLKKAILEKFSESAMIRLEKLTTGLQLGDNKPSHLLNQMIRTNATTDELVVRNLWMKRLPKQVCAVIRGILEQSPDIPINQIATTADAIVDSMGETTAEQPSIASNSTTTINAIGISVDERVTKLEHILERQEHTLQQINAKLGQFAVENRHRSRDRSHSRPRRNNTPHRSENDQQQSTVCWFHREYGTKARKCIKPCTYSEPTTSKN